MNVKIVAADEKIAQWIADREALARSLDNAQQRHQQALASTAAVRLAVSMPPPGAHAVPAHASLVEALRHTMEAQMRTCGVEDSVQAAMMEVAREDFDSLLVRLSALVNATQPAKTDGAPMSTDAASLGHATGDARIQPRASPKEGDRLPAQTLASPTKVAREGHAEALRTGTREDGLAAARLLVATGTAAVDGQSSC